MLLSNSHKSMTYCTNTN